MFHLAEQLRMGLHTDSAATAVISFFFRPDDQFFPGMPILWVKAKAGR
jgi:hypothetical protein